MEEFDLEFLNMLYGKFDSVRFEPNTKWREKGSVFGDFIVISFGFDSLGFEKYEVLSVDVYKTALRHHKIKKVLGEWID